MSFDKPWPRACRCVRYWTASGWCRPAATIKRAVTNTSAGWGWTQDHFAGSGWNVGARYKSFGRKAKLEEIVVENLVCAFTHSLRGRLLKEGLKEYRCEHCGLPEGCGYLIPLELRYYNSSNNDHRLSNLRLLSPNCHALIANYWGKN